MQKIGLLRGINVGGKHKVPMLQLQQLFGTWGCTSIKTIGNSGNIIYELATPPSDKWMSEQLQQTFGFTIPFVSLPAETLHEAAQRAPSWWGDDKTYRHNAIFLLEEATLSLVLTEIGALSEFEQIHAEGSILFWSSAFEDRSQYGKTVWSKLAKMESYAYMTIRNFNTTQKLIAHTIK